jgi:hypothetical protein
MRPIVSEEGVVLGQESEAEVQRLLAAGVVNLDDDSDSDASRDPDEMDKMSSAGTENSGEDASCIVSDNDELVEDESGTETEEDEAMESADAVTSDSDCDSDSDGDWKPPPRPKRKAALEASSKISECAQLDAFDTAAAAAVMDEMSRESAKTDAADGLAVASIANTALRALRSKAGPKALKAPEDEEAWWRAIYRAGNLSEELVERLVTLRAEEASVRRSKALEAERKRKAAKARAEPTPLPAQMLTAEAVAAIETGTALPAQMLTAETEAALDTM